MSRAGHGSSQPPRSSAAPGGGRGGAAPPAVLSSLQGAVGDPARVTTRAFDRHALAHDASHFLLTPQAVVMAADASEVGAVMRACSVAGVPLTFRSGGTSLSGQAVTDGVLLDVRRGFREIEVLDAGARVRVQPGATVRQVNARLAAHGRKLGPDPASEVACTIGGVVANNSSGMACGTTDNAYRTLVSVTLVLPSGTVVDTGAEDADDRLRALEPALHAGLLRLRDRVRADPASVATIRRLFAMKNTMGYGLNSFLDHDRAVDVLAHLAVGSEGTLVFIAEAVFATVPVRPHAATGLMVFTDLHAATSALPALVATGAATVELMDAVSLRVAQTAGDAPEAVRGLAVREHAALLVEYQADDAEELAHRSGSAEAVLAALPVVAPFRLSGDVRARARLWHLRKGLYAAVAGARPAGTTALLEDVVVPVPALAGTCTELGALFTRYGYRDSVVFGHAKDGNVHFLLTDAFEQPAALARYAAFTEDLVDLVLGRGGSLKAEHGTGRVMAPFVRRQYGEELHAVMREVKALCDPTGVLSPGVVLDDDPRAHLRHLKAALPVEPEVDRCVECGYCEPVCPSRDLTTTPRQRIVVRRAIARAAHDGDTDLVAELERDYDYDAVQTCAVDGMCQTACPVDINTGDLVKRLRAADHGRLERRAWATAAGRWGPATRAAGTALSAAQLLPAPVVRGPNRLARRVLGKDAVPLWSPDLPRGGRPRARPAPQGRPAAVYLPACVGSMFGPTGTGVQHSLEELCRRAGLELAVPDGVDQLCCGTPWSSKGLPDQARTVRRRLTRALRDASQDGQLPVVCDASSCTEGLVEALHGEDDGSGTPALVVLDAVQFVADRVLPLLSAHPRIATLTLHPTCSSTRLGADQALRQVAAAVAETVHVPPSWGCCAFAGDRGMLHPELTASATTAQAAEVRALGADAHASCNRTCEIGMTRSTGADYHHVLELLEQVTGGAPQ